jgi:hypothetical protein
MEDLPKSQFAELACDHNICKDCLARGIELALNEGETEKLNKCLILGCKKPLITNEMLRNNLPELLFKKVMKKFEDLGYINLKEVCKKAWGKEFRQCPYCPWYYANEGQIIHTCQYCNNYYCSDCQTHVDIKNEIVPHAGKTCQQMKALKAHPVTAVNQAADEIHFLTTRVCPKCGRENMPAGGCMWVVRCPCHTQYCFGCGGLDKHHHAFACRNAFIHEVKQKGAQFEYTIRFGKEVNLDFTGKIGNPKAEKAWQNVVHNPKRDEYLREYVNFLKNPRNYSAKKDCPPLKFLTEKKYSDKNMNIEMAMLNFFGGDVTKLVSDKPLDLLKDTIGAQGNPVKREDLIDVPQLTVTTKINETDFQKILDAANKYFNAGIHDLPDYRLAWQWYKKLYNPELWRK